MISWAIYANTYEGKSLSRLVSSTLVYVMSDQLASQRATDSRPRRRIKDELHAFRHILSPANPKYTPENAKWGSLVPSSLEGQVEYARVRRDARALHETLKGHTAEDDELVVRWVFEHLPQLRDTDFELTIYFAFVQGGSFLPGQREMGFDPSRFPPEVSENARRIRDPSGERRP